MADPKPKKIMSDNAADFWTTQSDDNTQICVGIISDIAMTRDEFLEALQFFIDDVIEKDIDFLEPAKILGRH